MTTAEAASAAAPQSQIPSWVLSSTDTFLQTLVRVFANVFAQIESLRTSKLSANSTELRQQALALQQLLSHTTNLATNNPDSIRDPQAVMTRLRAERDEARQERDEHMSGEGHLQQRLVDAELIMNRLASAPAPAPAPAPTPAPAAAAAHTHDRAEKIADPDKFDRSQEKLKSFKDQLMLKTCGNAAHFPNTQHMLRYAYQFLTGKAQRTMWIHLCKSTNDSGEETYEILFDSFAAFLATLNRHLSNPDEKHTAALALDKLRQANRKFGLYYADFQELMDILETMDDTSRRQALKHRLNYEMLSALAICPAPKDESFDEYIQRLNKLDCRLRALATQTRNQHRLQAPRTLTRAAAATPATASIATGTAASPIHLSAATGKLTPAERQHCRTQSLCMYCGGVSHFAAECPARHTSTTAETSGRRTLPDMRATMTPISNSDSKSGKEEAQE